MARIKRPLKRGSTAPSLIRLLRTIIIVLLLTFAVIILRQGDAWYKHTAKHRRDYHHTIHRAQKQQHLRLEEGRRRVVFTLANLKGDDGEIVIETVASWAPRGVAHFWELVDADFFTNARFFRVLPNFIAQFGIPADPASTWSQQEIPDDPVVQSNSAGTLTFATAGPNTRTTQLFINLHHNKNLDKEGFAPIGRIVEGMEHVYRIQDEHREKPKQNLIHARGNAYLDENFPSLSYIKAAQVV